MAKRLSWTAVNLCINMIPTKKIEMVLDKIEAVIRGTSFSNFKSWQKNDLSYVTSIDLELQSRFVEIIRMAFPFHNILYEEGKQEYMTHQSEYTWVIDPIDGTNNLVKGKNEFGSSVGLMYKQKFIAALVVFPLFNESYMALTGIGIYKNGTSYGIPRVEVNRKSNGREKEIILCSKTFDSLKDYFSVRENEIPVTCYYCATYSLLKVLKAEALLYHTINTKIYDVGPMSFVLSQAKINSYNQSAEPIAFKPTLDIIPFFIAAREAQCVEAFILRTGHWKSTFKK